MSEPRFLQDFQNWQDFFCQFFLWNYNRASASLSERSADVLSDENTTYPCIFGYRRTLFPSVGKSIPRSLSEAETRKIKVEMHQLFQRNMHSPLPIMFGISGDIDAFHFNIRTTQPLINRQPILQR